MRNLFSLLCILFIGISANCQCNTERLQKRQRAKDIPMSEKIIGIRLMARLAVVLVSDVNNAGSKSAKEANAALSNGTKPNLLPHIEYLQKEKLKIESYKQRDETNRLDSLVYCYLAFEINSYQNLQEIINKNPITNIVSEIKKYKVNIIKAEDQKIDDLNAEIKYLELKYPLHSTN